MKLVGLFLGVLALAGGSVGIAACNGLLGIQAATVGESDAGGGGVEAGVNCDYYCQTITANCTTTNDTEFQNSLGLCQSMCNDLNNDALEMGTLGDTSGNTLGCRIHYAELAGTSDPATNCRFAGPLGGGRCGQPADACNDFCSIAVPYCVKVAAPDYVSVTDCNNHCNADAGYPGYSFLTDGGSTGVDLPEATNTLNCRFYHLENAYPSKAKGQTHCPHTMPVSAVCINP